MSEAPGWVTVGAGTANSAAPPPLGPSGSCPLGGLSRPPPPPGGAATAADSASCSNSSSSSGSSIGSRDLATRLNAIAELEALNKSIEDNKALTQEVDRYAQADAADVGGPVHKVIGDTLRISYAEARRRLRDAEQLSGRLTLTGQELPPELPATARSGRGRVLS